MISDAAVIPIPLVHTPTWSYHLGARIQGPAQAQLLQIEK